MYRFCNVNFIEFWEFTPAESSAMLKIANEKFEYDTIERAVLLLRISNAPHFTKQNKKPWELNDFLPDFAKHEPTPEEVFDSWWNGAT